MAEVIEMRPVTKTRARARTAPRLPRAIVPVDLSNPELAQVAGDWLFAQCSDEGRRKLLEQHHLLAA